MDSGTDGQALRDLGLLWDDFGRTQCSGYSLLYEEICAGVAHDTEILAVVREAPPAAHMPPVLLASVRFILLGGVVHELGDVYAGTSSAPPYAAFRDFVLSHRAAVLDVMATRRTQTNEVGRCSLLAVALAEVQRRSGGPLAVLDVGASAGLNLLVDAYGFDYGAVSVPPAAGAPTILCEVVGPQPPALGARLDIVWRRGLDRTPIDVTDEEQCRWLEACVWPDQRERIERLRGALAFAAANPPVVLRGDAVDALTAAVADAPADAMLTVVTTWAFAFLHKHQRRAFVDVLESLDRPVSWIAGDSPGVVPGVELGPAPVREGTEPSVLSLHEITATGTTATQLAWAHHHGAWLSWVDEAHD